MPLRCPRGAMCRRAAISVSYSHSCAWTYKAITVFCTFLGSCPYVRPPGGSSMGDISWAISASVCTWNDPVLLMTMGMISISPSHAPWSLIAWTRGAYLSLISAIVTCMSVSLAYLHSMSCMTLGPVNPFRFGAVGLSGLSGGHLQPFRRIMSGLWPVGSLFFGRRNSGILAGGTGITGLSCVLMGMVYLARSNLLTGFFPK